MYRAEIGIMIISNLIGRTAHETHYKGYEAELIGYYKLDEPCKPKEFDTYYVEWENGSYEWRTIDLVYDLTEYDLDNIEEISSDVIDENIRKAMREVKEEVEKHIIKESALDIVGDSASKMLGFIEVGASSIIKYNNEIAKLESGGISVARKEDKLQTWFKITPILHSYTSNGTDVNRKYNNGHITFVVEMVTKFQVNDMSYIDVVNATKYLYGNTSPSAGKEMALKSWRIGNVTTVEQEADSRHYSVLDNISIFMIAINKNLLDYKCVNANISLNFKLEALLSNNMNNYFRGVTPILTKNKPSYNFNLSNGECKVQDVTTIYVDTNATEGFVLPNEAVNNINRN